MSTLVAPLCGSAPGPKRPPGKSYDTEESIKIAVSSLDKEEMRKRNVQKPCGGGDSTSGTADSAWNHSVLGLYVQRVELIPKEKGIIGIVNSYRRGRTPARSQLLDVATTGFPSPSTAIQAKHEIPIIIFALMA
jgi:hypothetical protein